MSCRWRADRDRWEVKWREHGRQRSRLLRFQQDALDLDNELYRRKRMGFTLPFDTGTETLADWGEYAWGVYFQPRLAPSTQSNYAYQWDKHVIPALGEFALRELDAGTIARFAGDLRRQGAGDATIRRMLGMLSKMLRYAVVEGKIAVNPALVVEKPRQLTEEWPEPVAPDVVEAIRAVMRPGRDQLMVSLLGYAGLRPQELRGLQWQHLRGAKLRVFAPKTRRNRVIDVLAPLLEELEAFRPAGATSGHVLRGRGRQPLTDSSWRRWRKDYWLARAVPLLEGPDRRPYRLRGSFASLLAWEGKPITYVAAQLGHSVQTCSRYYLGLFEMVDLEQRVSAVDQVRAARVSVPQAFPNTSACAA